MKQIAIVAALCVALAGTVLPAGAAQWVQDGAGLFSPATVSALTSQLDDFNAQTRKQIYVITVASLNGQTIDAAAERAFAQNQVNGVLFYISKGDHQLGIYPDRAGRQWFPSGTLANIRSAMLPYFKNGDYDQGIKTGVNLVLDTYRSHLGSLKRTSSASGAAVPAVQNAPVQSAQTGGFSMSWIWWLLILLAGFLILRAIFRAMAGPRMYPPGYGGGPMQGGPMGGMPMGGPGYGGPGYGPMGGGGGGFWSGLLGGLGGAFIGNELFGRRDEIGGGTTGANVIDPGTTATPVDNSGWQSDAGQIDTSNAASGDWGGGAGGGWGDSGGGGGFDSGGGGFGDMGGGGDSSSW